MKPTIAILILLLCSCSAEKKLNKLIAKHPELRDTIYVHDTLTTELIRADTTFVSVPGDTVRVDNGKLHIKYVRLPGDTVWLEGQCDPDTVITTTIVERIGPTKTVNKIPFWIWLLVGVMGMTSLILAFRK